ncbi:MAG: nucleotidyltransferase substrate binding protein [Selenomonadaceae bacterium]|nr:nucleotidyltransferase substrate binding protein [Selenomonadaceae bacterium]MBQ3726335.1 nucleotidyltransferase substrate binding protein [Selenomonadaceae bacterium]
MKKFENFCRALNNLKEIEGKSPPYDAITTAGMVALFEICFEQAWKAMKEILELHGVGEKKIGSPKMIIKQAYAAGMIDDENLWLEVLAARNNVAHSYNEEVALEIIDASQKKFLALFQRLKDEIEKNWG